MQYYALFKNSFTNAPITGLALSWASLIKASDGTAFTPQPAFTEVGGGYYKFTVSPTQDLLGRIDGGAALAVQDRYVDVVLSPVDATVAQTGDAFARLGAPAGASIAADVAANGATAAAIKAKTDNLPASPAAVGSAMTLTAAYDSAKTAASQSSVDAIPTTPLLSSDDRLANLDAAISTRLAAAGYTAPDNAGIANVLAELGDGVHGLAALVSAISSRLAASAYTAPDNASAASILSVLQDAAIGLARLDAELDAITASIPSLAKDADVQTLLIRESAPVVIPLVPASATAVNLTSSTAINLKRGDTYRLTFSLGRDCTGWTGYFAAKRFPDQVDFDMELREVVFSNQVAGTGYVDLSADDTGNVGTFTGEIELRKEGSRNTPRTYTFKITDDIIK